MRPIYRCRVCGAFTEERVHCGVEAVLLLDARRRVMLSKLMSGLLRHYPWEAGLRLRRGGWVRVEELVEGIRERWRNRELYGWVRREHVEAVALLDPKGRFELRDGWIRARYGHSVRVEIEYPVASDPPPILYHGTSRDRVPSILARGLLPMKRLYVHLTRSMELALENARRHGAPIILLVDTLCLRRHGIPVYRATDDIYLAPRVPSRCIRIGRGEKQ